MAKAKSHKVGLRFLERQFVDGNLPEQNGVAPVLTKPAGKGQWKAWQAPAPYKSANWLPTYRPCGLRMKPYTGSAAQDVKFGLVEAA